MATRMQECSEGAGRYGAAEWHARTELAALYRLVALHGWDDLIFTHISARVPGPDHHFLINPYGLLFEEITASSLVKIDVDGKLAEERDDEVNPAGFTIHSAVHMAREDAQYVMHLHTQHGIAVSAQDGGLLPVSQHALIAMPRLSYHDYEGIALDLDERERLVSDLGDVNLMILRNHGTMALGRSAAECWGGMYFLEKACAHQIGALSAGRGAVRLASDEARSTVEEQTRRGVDFDKAWAACLRRLAREAAGYER